MVMQVDTITEWSKGSVFKMG